METIELGAGSYPEPQENTKTIHIKIHLIVGGEFEVPKDWDKERIEDDIRANLAEYVSNSVEEDYEVEL